MMYRKASARACALALLFRTIAICSSIALVMQLVEGGQYGAMSPFATPRGMSI
jgi:hypothetical protein